MQLLYQTHSPYARKVLVFAHETGLAARMEVVHHETSPTRRNDTVFALNPLGKVPVLVVPQGEVLFDSIVICEYLDGLHAGPRMIPAEGPARWKALRLQALAQGLADAGIALRWETERRPMAKRYLPLADGYTAKLLAGYDYAEGEVPEAGAPVDIGQIALACALDWLAFRELPDFRAGHPRLARWFDAFRERPSMRATPLSGQTQD
ncbi:MAG: glutathione S-transferase family protein [Pseudomonadota bacterium]